MLITLNGNGNDKNLRYRSIKRDLFLQKLFVWPISCDVNLFDLILIDDHSVKMYRKRSHILSFLNTMSSNSVNPSPYTCASFYRPGARSKKFEIISSWKNILIWCMQCVQIKSLPKYVPTILKKFIFRTPYCCNTSFFKKALPKIGPSLWNNP